MALANFRNKRLPMRKESMLKADGRYIIFNSFKEENEKESNA